MIIFDIVNAQGWNVDTMLQLAEEYIDITPGGMDGFIEFLQNKADEENKNCIEN